MSESLTLIEAGWILTVDRADRVLADHTLVIDADRIVDCLPWSAARERFASAQVVDRRSAIVMPGLINTHTHLAMNLLRGIADDLPLMTWLNEHIWPIEGRHLSAQYVRDGTELALAECVLGGVTTVNDMYFFPDAVASACRDAGVRATVSMLVFDFATPWAASSDEYFDRGLALHDTLAEEPLLRCAFAPHAPYTVSRKPLERIAMLAAELDVPVHMHVHETAAEVEDFVAAEGVRPLARLDDIGLLTPSMLAVHMTQLTGDEMTRAAETGLHVVHCPASNLKLASGFCPVAALVRKGVNVALGTDGAASNNSLDLISDLRMAALLAKAVGDDAAALPAAAALRMVTINAATALGIENLTGSLEAGKAADVIVLEPDLSMLPMYDPVSQLAYATSRDRVRDVWVAGRRLLEDRQLQTLDAEAIAGRAKAWADTIARGRNARVGA